MKKIKQVIFLSALVLPSATLFAEEALEEIGESVPEIRIEENGEKGESIELIPLEESTVIIKKDYLTSDRLLWDLQDGDIRGQVTERLKIEQQAEVSYGTLARILCEYIGKAPISLPMKEAGESGYIGRLILEGIWEGIPTQVGEKVKIEQWEILLERVNHYSIDPIQYEKDFLSNIDDKTKSKLLSYKEQERKLGEFDKVILGEAERSDKQLQYNGQITDLYKFNGKEYISIQGLEYLGFNVVRTANAVYITDGENFEGRQTPKIYTKEKVSFNPKDIYIGYLKTYALTMNDGTLIPIEVIEIYCDTIEVEGGYQLERKGIQPNQYLSGDKNKFINRSNVPLSIRGTNLYWDGTKIIEERWDMNHLTSGISYPNPNKVYTLSPNKIYLTTIINEVKIVDEVIWNTNESYGQANKELLNHYEAEKKRVAEAKQKEAAKELFPPSIIIGTIKYDVGPFKKGDKVEVYRADSLERYYLHYGDQIIKVPWNSVSIPPNPKVETKQATTEQIEAYINGTGLTSPTNYLVWTDLYRQRTYIFKKQNGQWKLYENLICSTGKNITPTPRGVYSFQAYVPYFGVNKGYRCKNAVQIFGDYLYHSIMYDKTGTYLLEGKGVLGQRASQGCIRFSPEDSVWFYNTMPLKTTVWIN
ncbi:MAG: L,D-transpeptidase [Cellulosilyticaceae bacterium]